MVIAKEIHAIKIAHEDRTHVVFVQEAQLEHVRSQRLEFEQTMNTGEFDFHNRVCL